MHDQELERTLLELLARHLGHAGAEEVSEEPQASDLRPWRDRIDLIDRLVLALLNERSRSANAIGHIKKVLDMPVYVPSREADVIRNVRDSNRGPLPDSAVQHLFERIIDETRALERKKYQDEPDTSDSRSPE